MFLFRRLNATRKATIVVEILILIGGVAMLAGGRPFGWYLVALGIVGPAILLGIEYIGWREVERSLNEMADEEG